jgi:cell division protein FtsN
MPRDYKYRVARRKKSKKISPVAWLLAGLSIGLFGALLVYLQFQPASKNSFEDTAVIEPIDSPEEEKLRVAPKAEIKPVPPPPKPRFDFYNLLPEMEVVIPEQEITGTKKAGVKTVEKPGIYLLQAGSFRNPQQADQLKAKLALQGLETRVDSVTTNNGKWHRVRVGPYEKLEDLNRSRSTLKQSGIDAILIRLKK